MDGYAPKAPEGAIGAVYGDFFPRDERLRRSIREYSPYWDIFSYPFSQILILFLLLQVFIGITVVR